MKLCTVIAYYKTSITEQLKCLNSYYSIVCCYCSVLCLMAKRKLKYDQFFKFFQIKRNSHSCLFNEDPKNIIFFQGGPNFGGGTAGKFREIDNNRDIYCYANRRVVDFETAIQPLPSGTKILVMP